MKTNFNQKYKCIAIGGTFDNLHKGHKTLIIKAFELSERVLIGLTDDVFYKNKKYFEKMESYKVRRQKLKNFIESKGYHNNFKIIKIVDKYGPTIIDKNIDAIIVSKETSETAQEINKIRQKNRLPPLEIYVIDLIMAYDGNPISSTRIRKGEINSDGELNLNK